MRRPAPLVPNCPTVPAAFWDTLGLSQMFLGKRVEQCRHVVAPVTLRSGKVEKFLQSSDDGAALRCTGDDDGPATTKLQESLVSKYTQRTQNGVGVHSEHSREILCLRNAIAGTSLAFGDGSPDLGGHLFVERQWV